MFPQDKFNFFVVLFSIFGVALAFITAMICTFHYCAYQYSTAKSLEQTDEDSDEELEKTEILKEAARHLQTTESDEDLVVLKAIPSLLKTHNPYYQDELENDYVFEQSV